MSIEENVQIVTDFFTAIGSDNKQGVLALVAEDIEWIIPGEDWPLAGTHRGHAGLAVVLQKASDEVEMTYPKPPEFVAQGDRVLAIGVATGKIKATNKTFRDDWVFDITVRKGRLTKIREYIDTLLKANGEDVKTVQELLRHANSKITLDVYTQAVNSNKRAAQSKVVKMMVSSEGTKTAIVGTTDSRKQAQNVG